MSDKKPDKKKRWTEEDRVQATIVAQTRAHDFERMLDQQLRMIRTLQEQCNAEMVRTDSASGSFADRQTVSKMTSITNMLAQAAKTKIDLAKAYEKLDQVMSPEKRVAAMIDYITALPTEARTEVIKSLANRHQAEKDKRYNKQGARSTAIQNIAAALEEESTAYEPEAE